MIGEKYNRLTITEYLGKDNHGKHIVKCKCDCGNENHITRYNALKRQNTKSCGCIRKEKPSNLSHGLRDTKLYNVWANMKQRCLNEKNPSYKYYGGRGITICDEWANDFHCFYSWAMCNGWNDELEVDRIDNNMGYSPENCRIVSHKQNCRNQNRTILVPYNGEQKPLIELCDQLSLSYGRISQRIYKLKMPLDKALSHQKFSRKK